MRAAPLSPGVGQSDCARCGRLTIFLPHFDLRLTLVPGIEAEPPPSFQWWRRLSAVAMAENPEEEEEEEEARIFSYSIIL